MTKFNFSNKILHIIDNGRLCLGIYVQILFLTISKNRTFEESMSNNSLFILLLINCTLSFAQRPIDEAQKLYDSKNFEAAKLLLQKIYADDSANDRALELLSNINGIQENWAQAVLLFKKLHQRRPQDAEISYRLGGVTARLAQSVSKIRAIGLLNDIESAFKRTIQIDPNHIGARWALIEYYLQVPRFQGGGESKAKRYADELDKLSAVDGCLAKGHIEEFYGRFSQAEIFYLAAIKLGNSKTCYQKLADLYRNKMDRPKKADDILREYQNQKI